MIKLKSKVAAMLLSIAMVGVVATTPVQAASSVSGDIKGSNCVGSIEFAYAPGGAANGVRAKTAFGNGGTIKVTATVCYQYSGKKYKRSASNTVNAGGVTVLAQNGDKGNVYGGIGNHYVASGAYTWNEETKIGYTW